MKKVPYKVESNIFTVNGPLMEFNGFTMPSGNEISAKRFSKENPFYGICRLQVGEDKYTCEPKWRYFLNGVEYKESELFEGF